MALINKLKAIADVIRGKIGQTATMTMDEMVAEIEALPSTAVEDALINNDWSEIGHYSNSRIISLKNQAFRGAVGLAEVSFLNATSIGEYAFYDCESLEKVECPLIETAGTRVLAYCDSLRNIEFPKLKVVEDYAFSHCSNAKKIVLNSVETINDRAFQGCYSLTALIISQSSSTCILSTPNCFIRCYHILGTQYDTYNPGGLKDGYIYVPDSLVDSYKSATNWSAFASQIKGLSELPEEFQ